MSEQSWPDGATWVGQFTVTEDATAGTHVCSLTVSPGAGNEFYVLYGQVINGGAAVQDIRVTIDDGTNDLTQILQNATSSAGTPFMFPVTGATVVAGGIGIAAGWPPLVSGTMRLVLRARTSTISVTHTFAVVCRIKGAMPTATLADTVGTPVLTTNTNAVF